MEQNQAKVRREPVAGDSDRQHRSHRGSEVDRSSISRTGTSSLRRERKAPRKRDVNLLTTTRTTVVVLSYGGFAETLRSSLDKRRVSRIRTDHHCFCGRWTSHSPIRFRTYILPGAIRGINADLASLTPLLMRRVRHEGVPPHKLVPTD